MSVDEQARHELHLAVERALGGNEAATLMSLLPPAGWADVATKGDFEAQRAVFTAEMDGLRTSLRADMGDLRAELRGEMGDLRAELRGEMGDLRGEMGELRAEMGELRAELRGEMGELRAELRGEMGDLRAELRGEMVGLRGELTGLFEARLAATTRTILLALIGFMITTWAAVAGLGLAALSR